MSADMASNSARQSWLTRLPIWIVILGVYLSLRGYHSYDGDQAYRLPLLLHRQDPRIFADDPFVKAFDRFNPHRGSLAVLDLASRPLGLSAGLFAIFVVTFAVTCIGIDRLARAAWPTAGPVVGWVAIGLVLSAKAGNIGTNHLFEAMVLDRLVAFGLGWLAIAWVVADPVRGRLRPAAAIGLATWIHPSAGLQLAMALAAAWSLWPILRLRFDVRPRTALGAVLSLGLAVVPGLAYNLVPGGALTGGMAPEDFWILSAELQSPQHMLPHLWNTPRWLAWGCYLILAALPSIDRGLASNRENGDNHALVGRRRLISILMVLVLGLAAASVGIEVFRDLRLTIFQPFRMATIARGLALVLIAGRVVSLWKLGDSLSRARSILLCVGFTGDWLLVAITAAEVVVSAMGLVRQSLPNAGARDWLEPIAWVGALIPGLAFLSRHDTEFGNRTLVVGLLASALAIWTGRSLAGWALTPRRVRLLATLAWVVPFAALLAAGLARDPRWARNSVVRGLVNRCRFVATPADDIERLAVWCRENTPATARFIGPPGPKTFRLWSQRTLAFSRSASPYHAAGLADWFARFQDHVNFHGTPAEFAQAYLKDRHGFEKRYLAMSEDERAALAVRQGATHVIAAAPADRSLRTEQIRRDNRQLELLHVEGPYAVYRVIPDVLAHRQR